MFQKIFRNTILLRIQQNKVTFDVNNCDKTVTTIEKIVDRNQICKFKYYGIKIVKISGGVLHKSE